MLHCSPALLFATMLIIGGGECDFGFGSQPAPQSDASIDSDGGGAGDAGVEPDGGSEKCPPDSIGTPRNYRSIGVGGVLATSGTASVAAAGSVVSFSVDLPDTVGRGDLLVLSPGGANEEETYILEVTPPAEVELQDSTSSQHDGAAYRIERAFEFIHVWRSASDEGLVARNRIEVGVCYADGPIILPAPMTIASADVDEEHFMWLTAAERHRHGGVAGRGVVVDGQGGSTIRIVADYTRIDGLEFTNYSGGDAPAIETINVDDSATGVLLTNLLIHDFGYTGVKADTVAQLTIRNSIFYDGEFGVRATDNARAIVQNCTMFGLERGVTNDDLSEVEVSNTLAVGNLVDFDLVDTAIQQSNVSSDDSAVGLTGVLASDQFVSTTAGKEDLHLIPTADAIGQGTPLTAEFCDDIDGDSREGQSWDVGADQR